MKKLTEQQFIDFIAELFEVDTSELSLDTQYQGLSAWDSLMHLRIVAELEENFGVEIPIDAVPDIKSLGQFFNYLS